MQPFEINLRESNGPWMLPQKKRLIGMEAFTSSRNSSYVTSTLSTPMARRVALNES